MKLQSLKVKIGIGADEPYYVHTNVLVPIEGNYYYLPTSYTNPIKCKLINYRTYGSVDNIIRVMAVIDIGKFTGSPNSITLKEISPHLLFSTKDQAAQYYLDNKKELNFDYLNIKKV